MRPGPVLKLGAHSPLLQTCGILPSPPGFARYVRTPALSQPAPRPPAQSPLPAQGQESPAATAYWYMTLLAVFFPEGGVTLRMAIFGGTVVIGRTWVTLNATCTLWTSTTAS